MTKKVDTYINTILAEVKFAEAHAEIKAELLGHVEESRDSLQGSGVADEDLDQEAILRLGEPAALGRRLNDTHQPKLDWLLIGMVCALACIGLFAMQELGKGNAQITWFSLGLIPFATLVFMNPTYLKRFSFQLYLLTCGGCLLSFFSGIQAGGQPYLSIFGLHIKSIDLSVVLFMLSLAGLFADKPSPKKQLCCLALGLIPVFGYLAIGSTFPAILFFMACVSMLSVASFSAIYLLGYAGLGALAFSLSSSSQNFLRIELFANAVKSEAHTDFVFAHLQSSSPGLGALALIVSICMVVYLNLLQREVRSTYGKNIIAGCTVLLGVSSVWSILANQGFMPMPMTGVNFPFLSYGGSLLVAYMGLIGLVVGVMRRKNIHAL